LDNFRILVVDDEEGFREGCKLILEPEGFQVDTAADGKEGLEKIKKSFYNLVLVDMVMPGINGLDLLGMIKEEAPETVAIMITGHATVETAVEAMKKGAFNYVMKPFTPDELLEVVKKAIEEKVQPSPVEKVSERPPVSAIGDILNVEKLETILKKYNFDDSALISILQDVQKELKYLPEELLRLIADRMNIPLSRVFGLATFYRAFSLKPRGRHHISICLGTACHVKGGPNIKDRLERELGIKTGETTPDGRFSMETVRCVGCCGLAPVIVIDENFHGKLNQSKIPLILSKYE